MAVRAEVEVGKGEREKERQREGEREGLYLCNRREPSSLSFSRFLLYFVCLFLSRLKRPCVFNMDPGKMSLLFYYS